MTYRFSAGPTRITISETSLRKALERARIIIHTYPIPRELHYLGTGPWPKEEKV